MTPVDLGMSGLVAQTKDFLGKRSLSRADTARHDRKQLVGLLTLDEQLVLPEGAQILTNNLSSAPVVMQGHVTSSYMSPTLRRSIALAVVRAGQSRLGETVWVSIAEGVTAQAVISRVEFYDPQAERQHA